MFNLVDALSSEAGAYSFPELSFSPFFERSWASLYAELLRVKSNRVFYRPAPARVPGQVGATRLDGERFQCKDEGSHGEPDASWEGVDAKGAKIEVRCWNHLHLRTARWVEVSVIQIIRHGASGKARDPKISWFVWKSDEPVLLAEVSPTYCLRYSHEHGYRFDKQELLWDIPRLMRVVGKVALRNVSSYSIYL